jgi:hypothetical protein
MVTDKEAFADKLKALKDSYDAQLGGRVDALENAFSAIGATGDAAGKIAARLVPSATKNSARRRRIWKFSAGASSKTARAQAPISTRNWRNLLRPAAHSRAPETSP